LGNKIIEYDERKKDVLEAMCGVIEEDWFKRQDQRRYQQKTSRTRVAENVTGFSSICTRSQNLLKLDQDFMVLLLSSRSFVITHLQDGSEEIANLDRWSCFQRTASDSVVQGFGPK
jgi:hypothetical protein